MVFLFKLLALLMIGGALGYMAGVIWGPGPGVVAFLLYAVLTHRRVFYRIY